MPFCPECRNTFAGTQRECPDCRVELVAGAPEDPRQGQLFESHELCKVPDEIMGLALKSFLQDGGVEAVLQDMRASFYGNVLSSLQGYWGRMLVPAEQRRRAEDLYAAFQKEFEKR